MKSINNRNNPVQVLDLSKIISGNSVELKSPDAFDMLMDKIGNAKYVLLGEASHGTHEYYTLRTRISKRLIKEKGFKFIAVEGDWPDCYRVNRYIKHFPSSGKSAFEVLHSFNRWPTWMWANWEIVALVEWLRTHNESLMPNARVGFYGLDVYSLWESMDSIIQYLDKVDKKAKQTAMNALKCFEPYGEEGQSYARATHMVPENCEEEVLQLLIGICKNIFRYNTDAEAVFSAEQNAHIIYNAEKYYRTMIKAGPESWNIRDHHMTDTLNRLMEFHGPDAKGIVWEHNTHIGDARATDMASQGMINLGQLLNMKNHKDGVYSIGFGSFKGTVVAANEWGDVMRVMKVPSAFAGSWENILHNFDAKNRIVFMNNTMKEHLSEKIIAHRAIGVVYHPDQEYYGNYVPSKISERYDAFIYLDKTSALHPLHIKPDGHQIPETYPFGV